MNRMETELKAKPLTDFKPGAVLYFSHINAGRTAKARVLSMGLRKGTRFKLDRSTKDGPYVISLSGNRLVLGRGVTDKIMVTEENPFQ